MAAPIRGIVTNSKHALAFDNKARYVLLKHVYPF